MRFGSEYRQHVWFCCTQLLGEGMIASRLARGLLFTPRPASRTNGHRADSTFKEKIRGRIRGDGNSYQVCFKTTHLILKYRVHHVCFAWARIATKHQWPAWTEPRSFQPCSRSLSSLCWRRQTLTKKEWGIFPKSADDFPRRSPYYWSNRQFEETRWLPWRPPYCWSWPWGEPQ